MDVRILDLDGAVTGQRDWVAHHAPVVIPMQEWGPRIRICASYPRYRRFAAAYAERCARTVDGPSITFCGSGDFHHVTVALLEQLGEPFNVLHIDKHPDWVGYAPLVHCGTWVNHALRNPNLQRYVHVGADLDLDNGFRHVAPWRALRSGKITTFPAVKRLSKGNWAAVPTQPLRVAPEQPFGPSRVDELCAGLRADLARVPLYVTIDKDVMRPDDAIVNWDSGRLTLDEVLSVVRWFVAAANGRLAAMDVVGDWSVARTEGLLRGVLVKAEHPALAVTPGEAAEINGRTNRAIVDAVSAAIGARPGSAAA
ncbi:MAG: hypothetical protein IPK07_17285 [Deltaproteobacteria bacterium]|nr:hypothetical protein [Deltaproteobacteria bacterium]